MKNDFRLDSPLSVRLTHDCETGLLAAASFELSAPIIALGEQAQGFPPFRMTLEGPIDRSDAAILADSAMRAFLTGAQRSMPLVPMDAPCPGCTEQAPSAAGDATAPAETTAPKKRARRARGARS